MFINGEVAISTELCEKFCSENTTCLFYETPVVECYNGQALFPDDPSWGPYDIMDDLLNDTSFVRRFYSSTDGSCRDETDLFELPFDECVGPFGQPRPWGIFEVMQITNILETSHGRAITSR
jgi:hypothetical protein